MTVRPINQQAVQMDAFALNILQNTQTLVPGEMGLRDYMIIDKIYKSENNNGTLMSLEGLPNVLDLRSN